MPRSPFACEPNPTAERLRQETEVAFDQLVGAALFKNLRILRALVGAAETRVAHGLQGVPQGWFQVSPRTALPVYETQRPDARFLYLATDVETTVALLVF